MDLSKLTAYEVIENRMISDVKAEGILLRHKKSGARIAVLSNDDDNKVFSIAFKTLPEDETGVPHIIEHTTLCGSDKFPVKDPFVELVKGSLNTFLNAMTYPDKTVYPVASYNDKDFKNLMDVYMDAVFHPNITKYKEIFMQEGWHYELEDTDAPITINGVVYNEMKGAYSSPEEVLQTQIFKSLFPDNTYSKDSGGNPSHIPELTYEYYLEFYHKYYHPANSYIYLYGDLDVAERLEWMDREYLSHYDYMQVDSNLNKQTPFETTKEVRATYSIASDDSTENQTYLSYNRVIGDSLDKELYQAMDVLDYALVSAPGAPVKQALIDAGIGEDVYGSYDGGVCQPVFSIVAKNANESDQEQFVEIIESTLSDIVKNGINKEALLAGINSAEFRFREADFGQFPKGLFYGLWCMDSWLFDEKKPFLHVECLDTLTFLKKQIDSGYFEKIIEKYLLNNTHGSTVVVVPQPGKNLEEEKLLEKRLEEYKKSLSKEELEALVEQTKHLKQYQEEPSPEEELLKIPMLSRDDLKKEALPFINEEDEIDGVKVVKHDIFSNGIDYMTILFDAEDVAQENIGYLGLLGSVLGYVDTESYSYADLTNAINIYTGGISSTANLYPNMNRQKLGVKYEFRIKVLEEGLDKALELFEEILHTSKLSDVKRLTEIVSQTKARLQVGLSSSGHIISSMRSLSKVSKYGYYQDAFRGIAYYRSICGIEKLLKENPSAVTSKLEAICAQIFAKNRMLLSFTAEEKAYQKAKPILAAHFERIKDVSTISAPTEIVFDKKNEAFTDSSAICYVARTGNFAEKGYEYHGALRILKMIMSYDYLWINIRVKGGAYGCMSSFMRNGDTYFVSYRDPNLKKTNEVYDGITEYLKNFNPDERDMTKYIIGTFGAMDTPMNPEAKGNRSLAAYIGEIPFESIQKERNQVLFATVEDIRGLADMMESVLEEENLCVIGNETMIHDAKDMFDCVEKLC
ncbi:MAG: insulinase family protein [Lachnospiraceae bacterium]